jgi:serine/threonine protein kinase
MPEYLGRQLGNYKLIQLLGAGGFAEVYLGEHIYLKTEVAIKVLHTRLPADELEPFLAEARTVARLRHPHIVRVLEFGVEDTTPFLVMDYAPNGTLRQRFRRGTPLAPAVILPYLRQVAEALDYAHEQRLIHRDVKPENMLLGHNQEVLLSDFGIALVFHSSRSQTTQEVVGSVSYMAPEQVLGKPRPASDQYALGVVAYEWLSGERPFNGNFSEVAAQQLHMPAPALRERVPTLSPAIEQVVLTALAKDYRARFPSARAFVDALEQAQAVQPQGNQPDPFYIAPTQRGRFSSPVGALVNEPTFSPSDSAPTNIVSPAPPQQQGWASTPTSTSPTAQPSTFGVLRGQPAPAAPAIGVLTPPGVTPSPPTPAQPSRQPRSGISRRAVVIGGLGGLASLAAIGGGISWFVASQHPTTNTANTPTAKTPTPGRTPTSTAPSGPGATLATYHASGTVYALAWSPDSRRIASLGDQGNAVIWEALTGKNVLTYLYPNSGYGLLSLAWSPNGEYIVATDSYANVYVFSTSSTNPISSFVAAQGAVFAVTWSPNSSRVAAVSGPDVLVWDAPTGKNTQTLPSQGDTLFALSWSPDGTKIAAGGKLHTVQVWDAGTGETLFTCPRVNTGQISAVAWSPDSTLLAVGSLDQTIRMFDGTTGKEVTASDGFNGPVYALAWSPDGKRLAWSSDNYVQVAAANLQSANFTHQGHTDTVLALAWSPNGKYIASGGADEMIQVWNA